MATLTDAALVQRILGGDTAALSVLYDRYADRIHSMCVHMLRNDDEAADVTAEVFLTAAERLEQLRDHDKLRPWLYAIARNEVFRRTRHRRRETSLDALGSTGLELGDDAFDADSFESVAPESNDGIAEVVHLEDRSHSAAEVGLDAGAAPADLADLLQDAAAGLDERDRMVLELHLAQGLDGQELADALGVSRDNGYQLVHRMKERLERATSALLIARSGRSLCDGLDEVADAWDGNFSVLWRKRFARHIERCERCSSLRSRVPKAVLAGTALAVAAQSTVLAAPISARERFLSEAPQRLGAPRGGRWRSDGFPPHAARRRRWPVAAGTLAIALLAVIGGSTLLDRGPIEELVASAPSTVPTSSTVAPTTVTPLPTVPLLPGEPAATERTGDGDVDGSATVTTTTIRAASPGLVPRVPPTVVVEPVPAPPPEPPPTEPSTTTTTTAPADTRGPSVSMSGPGCVKWGGSGTFTANASDPSGISSLTISWSGATSGSKSTSGGSLSVTVAVNSPTTGLNFTAVAVDGAGNTGRASTFTAGGPTCA